MEYLHDQAFNYYGCDWAAMALTFLSLYLLGNQSRTGFLIGIIANFFWFSYGYQTDSIANMFCSFVVICLQARGWNNWKPKPATDTAETAAAD
jgi:nicotinamide riboside transporter PnuC